MCSCQDASRYGWPPEKEASFQRFRAFAREQEEKLRKQGNPKTAPAPSNPHPAAAVYKCEDCKDCVTCKECIVKRHSHLPYHRILKWNGEYLERAHLADLGLVWSLRHVGSRCPYADPTAPPRKLKVADSNGYKKINVEFCRCGGRCALPANLDEAEQLFEVDLWPITLKQTRTVITFDAMENFIHHHSADKKSTYSWCAAIRMMTDPIDASDWPVRYLDGVQTRTRKLTHF